MRRLMIGTGWKMNKTIRESLQYIELLLPLVSGVNNIDIFVLPSFTALQTVHGALLGSNVAFGAQNLFWEDAGAYTGEISPLMLVECGCRYAEMGHQERRRLFAETDETVGKKARAAWDHELVPIICIGEPERPDRLGDVEPLLRRQITSALELLSEAKVARSILAYEPAWAIGVGAEAAESGYVSRVHGLARAIVSERFGCEAAAGIRILYGGSVQIDNAPEFLGAPEVDGLFVGRAALDPLVFARIVHMGSEWARRNA